MSAVISVCKRYRYSLYRQWDLDLSRMPILWVMLNPSTADSTQDDPTIRRCINFSKEWGYPAMWVGNVYAYRTAYPNELFDLPTEERYGEENNSYLWRMARCCALTVCAWGASGPAVPQNIRNMKSPGGLWCLGTTKGGHPKHPLYLPKSTTLREFPKGEVYAPSIL